jgi:small-conductance mechanosensitive channel
MNYEILGNPLYKWIFFLLTALVSYAILKILTNVLKKQLSKKLPGNLNKSISYILIVFQKTKLFFLLTLSIYIGTTWLTLPEKIFLYLRTFAIFVFWIQVGIWLNEIIVNYINLKSNQTENGEDRTTMSALKTILKIVLWSIIFILVVDNIPGVEITALVTSLGIGGIAIGLALQNILGDLFSSLSISMDKPFIIGDFIQVDNFFGTVEKIGLKSTRLRSISGEQLIFSNSDLLNSRVQNYKRLERRRVVITLGVLYQTTPEQLRLIPELIKSIFSEETGVTLDRIHLANFGDFSINYELVYWVESADYNLHMDQKQAILLKIFDKFIEHKIEFAYPTQSIFIEKN